MSVKHHTYPRLKRRHLRYCKPREGEGSVACMKSGEEGSEDAMT